MFFCKDKKDVSDKVLCLLFKKCKARWKRLNVVGADTTTVRKIYVELG